MPYTGHISSASQSSLGGGHGNSWGHPVGTSAFVDASDTRIAGRGNAFVSRPREEQALGTFHDEGGQIAVLKGEFFGEYRVKVGTQEMFDNAQEVTCYSGIAGQADRCLPFARQRRLSFVTPMGLPLGEVKVRVFAISAAQVEIDATLIITKRPLYSRLYSIARSFPHSYSTEVANSMKEAKTYV